MEDVNDIRQREEERTSKYLHDQMMPQDQVVARGVINTTKPANKDAGGAQGGGDSELRP